MKRLINIDSAMAIPQQYRDTPIGRLLEYHNLGLQGEAYDKAEILVGMCMDNRKRLEIPSNFAYIIRTGGGNLRYSEFKVSYAISIGGVRYIALIAHNKCGMVKLPTQKQEFIRGLVSIGWDKLVAADHYNQFAPLFAIDNEIDFVIAEAKRLRMRYPDVMVAPMHYDVDTDHLSLVEED